MNQTVYAFFYLDKYAEVRKVAYFGRMFGTYGVFLFNVFPRVEMCIRDSSSPYFQDVQPVSAAYVQFYDGLAFQRGLCRDS